MVYTAKVPMAAARPATTGAASAQQDHLGQHTIPDHATESGRRWCTDEATEECMLGGAGGIPSSQVSRFREIRTDQAGKDHQEQLV